MLSRLVSSWSFILTAAVAGTGGAFAQTAVAPTPNITAEDSVLDFANRTVVFRGNAQVSFGDLKLAADEMEWQRDSNLVIARGHAVVQRGDLRLLAEELTYHTLDRSYTVTDLRFGRAPLYFSGGMVEGTAEQLIFTDAVVSFGEPHPWSPTLTAKTLTYFPERERIEASGGRLGLGFFQPIPLPATPLPTSIPLVNDLTFDGGYTSRLGAHLLVGAQVPIAETVRVGAEAGFYTKRGVMVGPTLSYDWGTDENAHATGRFSSGYIYDTGRRLTDIRGQPISPNRGIAQWEHRQHIGEQLTLNADLHYWSDSEVLRDFKARDFFPVQVPDTYVDLSHVTANTVSGLFLRAQPNPYHQVRQRLPELTFDLLPTPFGVAGLVHEASASAAVLRDDPPAGGGELRSNRVDLYYALTRPWQPQSWMSVNPVAGVRLTHYADAVGGRSDYTRALGELGVDAEMRASAVFDYQNERWGIDGLRHLVTPRLSYRYIPDADKGSAYIPAIDRRVFATYLEPLALGARRQIDDLSRTHTLRLAVDQRLQTRDPIYGSRDLVRLNVAIDSRFDRAPGERTLSALHTELRLSPAPFVDLELYHRVTPGDWTSRELNTAITLRSADRWRLQFGNHYLAGDIQEFIAGFSYRVNEVWEGYTRVHLDSRRDRFVEQTYGVRQTIANRWIVGYELSFFEGPRRESDFGFNLVLDAIRF
ncbi:LPS-assembly protein LptD [Synoicihabitans lomoniglobus]|uniref:LPS assembly protein LptD n=1 Tax=Synoicihabitans lomoniglobus TaxID=2909285 RepID=A0AAF0I3N3_9BACT|nr:LPS assembly protein LptD [Opitutaceae bacterium LMO-M01]WED67182.1 LPS assembly protein LptD [Opitutaceae bacterium LMO-M01]